MGRFFSLARLAAAVWLSWALLLLTLAVIITARIWHPHFLIVTSLIALVSIAAALLVAGGVWRVMRGPRRLRSLAWLLVGSAPSLWLAAHCLYGLNTSHGRQIDLNWVLKLLQPVGESVADIEARFRYPVRSVGDKVVMISTPQPDAQQQVAAMDRHVRRLEEVLGSTIEDRVYWVRGPVTGVQGRASGGGCAGSTPGKENLDAEGLGVMDRHEVAHCVISLCGTLDCEPPTVLIEGWAQSHSGLDEVDQAEEAWEHRESGTSLSLRELTGPAWQGRHEWAVYTFGAPLVHYLLRTYGGPKFLDLYMNCRRATFADDCQRILGASLDEIDAACWAYIERLATGSKPPVYRKLEKLQLAPGICREDWTAFLDEYRDAADRLGAPYAESRVEVESVDTFANGHGDPEITKTHCRAINSGQSHLLCIDRSDGEQLHLACPQRSLTALRANPDAPWALADGADTDREKAFRRQLRKINELAYWVNPPLLLVLTLDRRVTSHIGRLAVTRFERGDEDGRPTVSIEMENLASPEQPVAWRRAKYVLAPEDHFLLQSYQLDRTQGELQYDRRDGLPMLNSWRTFVMLNDKAQWEQTSRVVKRQLGPTSADEFDVDKLLGGSVLTETPVVAVPDRGPNIWLRCSWAAAIAGCVSFAAGLVLVVVTRQRV